MGVHSPQKKAALDTSQHFAVPVWQISPQHFKRHRAKGEKRGRTHETAVKRRALISWPSSMDEFHTRLKTCPPKRERNLSPCSRIKTFFRTNPRTSRQMYAKLGKKKKGKGKRREEKTRLIRVERCSGIKKTRAKVTRNVSHEAGLYRTTTVVCRRQCKRRHEEG